MKSIISMIVSAAMVLALAGVSTAGAAAAAEVVGADVTVDFGQTVAVPVVIHDSQVLGALGNGTICGVEVNFSYDTTKLHLTDAQTALTSADENGAAVGWNLSAREYTDGGFNGKLLLEDPEKIGFAASGNVEIAVLYFQTLTTMDPVAEADRITTNITYDVVDICDSNAKQLAKKGTDGSAPVTGGTSTVTIDMPNAGYAKVSASDLFGYAGETVSIPLTLYNASAFAGYDSGLISNISMDLSYDASQMTFVSAASLLTSSVKGEDGSVTDQIWKLTDASGLGTVNLAFSDESLTGIAASGNLTFASVDFQIPEGVAIGTQITLVLSNVSALSPDGYAYTPLIQTRNVTITVSNADNKASDLVITAISAIGSVTSADQEGSVSAARAAYDALTDEQKALVANYDLLTAAEQSIADYKAADSVEALIDAASQVQYLSDKQTVDNARAAYDALSDAQKILVGNLDALTAAEQEMQRLSGLLLGDLEGDGNVTVADVVELRQIIMDGAATPDQMVQGDLDNNGTLTVSDVVDLRQYIMNGGSAS